MKNLEPVYLIDGSAYIYRAYHAITPLTNSKGLPTHAVYGFINIMNRVIREKNPLFMAIAFDMKGPVFRHEIYSEYKANRPPMPDDLACQLPYIKKVSKAMNILCLEQQGMEADDLIASAAIQLSKNDQPVVIISGDKDLLQLVDDNIVLWEPMADRLMDREAVAAKYNVGPEKLNDLFALIGDSSDNIPGVPGVGPKTADKLINEFSTLDGLYENISQLSKKKLKEKLIDFKDQAFLSKKLIALKKDLAVPDTCEQYRLPEPNQEKLHALYTELEFSRLLKSSTPARAMDTSHFHLITSADKLEEIITQLHKASAIILDTETTSLDSLTAELVGISLCVNTNEAWYIPVAHRNDEGSLLPGQLSPDTVLSSLRPILESPDIAKTGHNIKYDFQVLKTHGVILQGCLRDTMIASYLLNPSRRSHKLDDLATEHLNLRLTEFKEVTKKDKRPDSFSYVGLEAAKNYSCEDVAATIQLWDLFAPQLDELKLKKLFEELEMPLVPILARMEEAGILVNKDILSAMSAEFAGQLERLKNIIFDQAGEEFNINSPKQLGDILFEKLHLPHGRKTKTGYSTDVKVLTKLSAYHELPGAVLEHRTLSKLKSTYVDKLATLLKKDTGRVHTSFNQTVTATGRLSSSNAG